MTTLPTTQNIQTIADLLSRLGDIPPERVRFQPAPGTATEQDVLEIERRENRLCELVDRVLVEKVIGYRESVLAGALLSFLREFVVPRNLGLVSGADGIVRLFSGLVRIPDVAYASWERLPNRQVPTDPLPELAPDLVVDVLSKANTAAEMKRKRGEYFSAGVREVWIIDPDARAIHRYSGPEQFEVLGEKDVLDGGTLLAGFHMPLARLFAELDRTGKE